MASTDHFESMHETLVRLLVPNAAAALWLGGLVAAFLLGDSRRLLGRRNLSLAALFVVAVLLLDILSFSERPSAPWVWTGIYMATVGAAIWGLALSRRDAGICWSPNQDRTGLRCALAFAILLSAGIALGRPPDDAGYYSNLGAQRWTETGVLPYADAKLKGPKSPAFGAAATYGPLLYVAHIPFQVLTSGERNPADTEPKNEDYVPPPILATQLTTLSFFLAGLWALHSIVAHQAGRSMALAVTTLYAASPYVMGVGGVDSHVICGLAFISHIAPSSMMLLAFAGLRRPALAGGLLAAATGLLFYPLFVFPAWLGWYAGKQKRDAVRFAMGFVVVGLAIGALVVTFTPAAGGSSALSLFLESTLEHQEGVGPREYGGSEFGFWGTHPELAAFWQAPVAGSTSLLKPTFLVYAFASLSAFVLARDRSRLQLAGLTAALTAGVQLWKTHAGGTYVEWYLPFLLIAIFCSTVDPRKAKADIAMPSC